MHIIREADWERFKSNQAIPQTFWQGGTVLRQTALPISNTAPSWLPDMHQICRRYLAWVEMEVETHMVRGIPFKIKAKDLKFDRQMCLPLCWLLENGFWLEQQARGLQGPVPGPLHIHCSFQFHIFIGLLSIWMSGSLLLVHSLGLFSFCSFALFSFNVMASVLS